MELAATYVGEPLDHSEVLRAFDGRVREFSPGKWWILKFIPFQYGELSEMCKPHKAVLDMLKKHGVPIPLLKGSVTLQDKDKDKDGGSAEGGLAVAVRVPSAVELAEEIYQLYPLKVGKPKAMESILRSIKKFPSDWLRERVIAYAQTVSGTDTLLPHPATWFNQERFNDEPSTWVRQSVERNGHSKADLLRKKTETHPGNPSWIKHDARKVTADQIAEYRRLRKELNELERG